MLVVGGITLAITIIIGAGLYVLRTNNKIGAPANSTPAPTNNSASQEKIIVENKPPAELKTFKNEKYGIELQIPSDWTEQNTPESVLLTGQDKENNIVVQLIISKGTQIGLTCNQVIQDSTDLTDNYPKVRYHRSSR